MDQNQKQMQNNKINFADFESVPILTEPIKPEVVEGSKPISFEDFQSVPIVTEKIATDVETSLVQKKQWQNAEFSIGQATKKDEGQDHLPEPLDLKSLKPKIDPNTLRAEDAVQLLIKEYGDNQDEEIAQPDDLPEPVAIHEPIEEEITETKNGKEIQGLANGFENGKQSELFSEGEKVVIVKPAGSFQRSEGGKQQNITTDMVGQVFTFFSLDNGLAYLEDESGGEIYVPENSLSSFKKAGGVEKQGSEPEISKTTPNTFALSSTADKEKEQVAISDEEEIIEARRQIESEKATKESSGQQVQGDAVDLSLKKELEHKVVQNLINENSESIVLPGENSTIQIKPDQLWSLPSETQPNGGFEDYLIENIEKLSDGQIKITFMDKEPEVRTPNVWSEIFSAGELQGDKEEIASGDNVGIPGKDSGVENIYQNGKIVEEKVYIPEVKLEETEAGEIIPEKVAQADAEIVEQLEAAVPAVAEKDNEDILAEEGRSADENVGVPIGKKQTFNEFLNSGDPTRVSSGNCAGMEAVIYPEEV